MIEQEFYPVTFLSKQMITPDVLEFVIEKPSGMSFLPGQFVQFRVPDGEGSVLRSFSIASHPGESHLEFCTKLIPGGRASTFFNQLSIGDTVHIGSPKGAFVCADSHNATKIFVVTGTGIAPIMSMVKHRLGSGDTLQLLFGLRAQEDIFWRDRLEFFKENDSNFTYSVALSQAAPAWIGLEGRVTKHVPIKPEASYYLCGSVEMVKEMRTKLLEGAVDQKNIHFEIF